MKICPECNAKNFDAAKVCEKCKAGFGTFYFENTEPDFSAFLGRDSRECSNKRTTTSRFSPGRKIPQCAKAAQILMILNSVLTFLCACLVEICSLLLLRPYSYPKDGLLVACVLFTVLLFVMIPTLMTFHYSAALSKGGDVGIGFKVCTLIFINPVIGVLMILDNGD